jgi:hypothetical protein
MTASSSTAAAVAVSGSAAPVPAGASAAAGVVAPGAATSSSHVFVLKADLMKLSCDARASPYVINIENFGWEWLRYPDSLRTAHKYVRERGRVYWDSSHPICAQCAHNSTTHSALHSFVNLSALVPPPLLPCCLHYLQELLQALRGRVPRGHCACVHRAPAIRGERLGVRGVL